MKLKQEELRHFYLQNRTQLTGGVSAMRVVLLSVSWNLYWPMINGYQYASGNRGNPLVDLSDKPDEVDPSDPDYSQYLSALAS